MKNMKKSNIKPSERIAKTIAKSGLCSRRDAERLIREGNVTLNKKKISQCNINVTDSDIILINGKQLPKKKETKLWIFYKEKGYLVTNNDQLGRPTIFDKLKSRIKTRIISVGRLDMNSEGLLLLTNDGELARKLEFPSNGYIRTYKVRVHGNVDVKKISSLKEGIEINGIKYKSIDAKLDKKQNTNAWLKLSIKEGKNREIRKIMEHFGYTVNRLIRISYGPFNLCNLKAGDLKEINQRNLNKILKY